MNSVALFINDICSELHQLVNNVADGLFVTGNGICRNNNAVIWADGNLFVT